MCPQSVLQICHSLTLNSLFAAYDFLSSDQGNFNVFISYNSTKKFDAYEQDISLTFNQGAWQAPRLVQVSRLINMVSFFPS